MKKYFILSVIAALLILAGRSAIADYKTTLQQKVISPGYWEPTRAELRIAMRFHGVSSAREDQKHEWYFVRDGKKCKLFAYLHTPGPSHEGNKKEREKHEK